MTDISNPDTGGTAEPLPPVGTAAYQEISGDDGTSTKPKGSLGRTGIIAGVAALVVGILGGLGIGYAVWGNQTSTSAATGFPGGAGGFRGGNFTPPGGSGAEGGTGTRPGGFGGGGFAGVGANGKVASVSGNTIEVQGTGSQTTVNVNANTKVTKTVSGTSADVTTGMCARVIGATSSNGTVTANTIVLSQPTNGSCTTGFGGFGGANRGAGGARTGAGQ